MADKSFAKQPKGFDLLSIPFLRQFIRWKYARFVFQLPLLILAIFVLIDGFTGRQLAPRNVATTSVWLHYRGLVVLALALIGNAFCAACPLMLTRGPTKLLVKLIPRKLNLPQKLKNKYFVVAFLLLYFFSYEYFNLWASPYLTAWLAVGYFTSALVVDTLFPAGTFCRYMCPLGNFNFVLSSASPTQITATDRDICHDCKGKPCLHGRESFAEDHKSSKANFIPLSEIKNPNGQGYFPGCETDIFVPTIQSNMDCTNCFNCVRACPYDNVAFRLRSPTWEFTKAPWAKRGRLALMLMGVLLTFYGLMNALGMIGPFFQLATSLAIALDTQSEALILGIFFTSAAFLSLVLGSSITVLVTYPYLADLLGPFFFQLSPLLAIPLNTQSEALILGIFFISTALLGLGITVLAGYLADLLGQGKANIKTAFMRWGYVATILGIGFWTAHYLFHFFTGALSIIPVFEHFFYYRGFNVDPNWQLSQIAPRPWLFPINAGITAVYTLLALYVTVSISIRDFGRRGVLAMWPMLIYVLFFAALALAILAQPMEMRGTIFELDQH